LRHCRRDIRRKLNAVAKWAAGRRAGVESRAVESVRVDDTTAASCAHRNDPRDEADFLTQTIAEVDELASERTSNVSEPEQGEIEVDLAHDAV
jgi:hypothetical protein